jgi:hypothetical protein
MMFIGGRILIRKKKQYVPCKIYAASLIKLKLLLGSKR